MRRLSFTGRWSVWTCLFAAVACLSSCDSSSSNRPKKSTVTPDTGPTSMQITEYMYSGPGGEFVEFTNIGPQPVDMTGWSFDDDSGEPFAVDLGGFGIVAPGESVVLVGGPAVDFQAEWQLTGSEVRVFGSELAILDRNDQIHLFDPSGDLVDRLVYGDEEFPGTVQAENRGAWPCGFVIGFDQIGGWVESREADAQGSYVSQNGNLGSPGTFVETPFAPISVLGSELAFIRGDFDGSGRVGLSDVIRIVNYLFLSAGVPPGGCERAANADTSCFEQPGLEDVMYILDYLYLMGPPPPPPLDAPGREDYACEGTTDCQMDTFSEGSEASEVGAEFSGLTRLSDGTYLAVHRSGLIEIRSSEFTVLSSIPLTDPFSGAALLSGDAVMILESTPPRINVTAVGDLADPNLWLRVPLVGVSDPEAIAVDLPSSTAFVASREGEVFTFPVPTTAAPLTPLFLFDVASATGGIASLTRGLHFDLQESTLLLITSDAETTNPDTVWWFDLDPLSLEFLGQRQWLDLFTCPGQLEGVAIDPDGSVVVASNAGPGQFGSVRRIERD